MDNLNVLGSIASIITLFTPLGRKIWHLIKNTKISFFHFYMPVMVLKNAISEGICFRRVENETVLIISMILIFIILLCFSQSLFDLQRELESIKIQLKIHELIHNLDEA